MKKILLPFFILFNLVVTGYFWFLGSRDLITSDKFEYMAVGLGRLAGLCMVLFILLQLILIGRVSWVEKVFGLDKLSRWHHYNGIGILFFLIAHPLLITYGYAVMAGVSMPTVFGNYISSEEVLGAIIATGLFVAVIISSIIAGIRRARYELWYLIHLIVYVAIILAFEHQFELGGDFISQQWFVWYWYALYVFAIGNLLVFRFLRPAYRFYKHRFYVDSVVRETPSTVSLYIKGKKLDQFKIRAGQFMIMRFLDKKRWWQAHPFSLSCAPNGKYIRITIKATGDFTSDMGNVAVGTPVIIDGPNGIFTERVASKEKILFIAGGVGITPIRSMIEEIEKKGKDITLIYANRNATDIVFRQELDELAQECHFEVYHVLSDDTEWQGLKGRISPEMIRQLVSDVDERDVYVCGPPLMMDSVISILRGLFVPKSNIHFEKFSL